MGHLYRSERSVRIRVLPAFFEGLSRVNIAERDVVLRCGRWMDRLVRILISVVFPEVTDGGRVPLICPFLVKNRTKNGKSLEDMVS